ncbi:MULTISPECIES: transcription antitermination factor NusB [Brevibacillus]|jgi:N utilization substance protein B|uniref:Transcription antitermination protein NusB n=1 Tax=Brevibacillus borstelensis AK1 TaxID=1300222 RepID=M8DJF5_9BACL|nr:transcription antitermination factor NusB [Brevibacillus borstelensis]EMT53733.1 N utilization substance protein B [Brevibacillus borstelensis AK1]KKX56854.1 antitermination protein NusB [Brevibacillus borstelensis cifa_chp40]MBE5394646.1 transcription antitermination factor NusB [Brevibacillus borstelensis]MCC0562596.1 transcription antitermination factor NusB [Brevibacillus borstelensis]MCM3469796.1 transcription antitermination factor NusB [Brevibacillus borstelensis]
MKRRTAREKAVQCLFQIDMADVSMEAALELVMEDSEEDASYLHFLVKGVLDRLQEIDAEIQKYLRGWRLERIANVDRAILRLAFFEIMFEEDIPDKVALNEAIEIAKLFSDEQSYRYINGVLSSYLKARQTANA